MSEETREEKIINGLANRDYGAKTLYQPIFRACRSKGWSSKASFAMTMLAGALFSGAFVWMCWAVVMMLKS